MIIRVRHRTLYTYDRPVAVSQLFRLDPADRPDQRVIDWRVSVGPQVSLSPDYKDGYGNRLRLATAQTPTDRLIVDVEGTIETAETHGVKRLAEERAPLGVFLRSSDLTTSTPAVRAFAEAAAGGAEGPLGAAHALMSAVRTKIKYVPGTTDVTTGAGEVLAAGTGVCQDQAHLLIAAARVMGLPARYVSGYLFDNETGEAHSPHAWAEIHVKDLGWIGLDPANGISSTERHVAIAIGLDYRSAAPIVGVFPGRAEEDMSVHVRLAGHRADQ